VQLLMYQASTIGGGTPTCSSTARCDASAARKRSGHTRTRLSSRAAIRMAFGGHSIDTGCGRGVSAKPTFAPM
jgi:hypothetical protein